MAEATEPESEPAEPAGSDPAEQGPDAGEPAEPAGPLLPRRSAMAVRLIAVAVALVLAMAITFVVVVVAGPPSVADLRNRAGLDGRRELLIGVKDDQPGVALHDVRRNSWAGFDIDIAYLIAEDLGFRRDEVRFLAIESEDRARMQATDDLQHRIGVDLVVASYSITTAREAEPGVTFSAPYLYTEQSVLTLAGHPQVSTLEDLAGHKVCSLATATSETPAQKAGAVLVSKKKISECFAALDARQVDAVTTDAAILAGYKTRNVARYAHWDIGLEATEAWGVNVGENDALRDLVNLALYRSRQDPKDSRWEDAFDRNLRVEEASNQPAPIAVDQQPEVRNPPDVRQWPWERVGP